MLILIFLGSLFLPKDNDWSRAFSGDWELDGSSIIGKMQSIDIEVNRDFFADGFESISSGKVTKVDVSDPDRQLLEVTAIDGSTMNYIFDIKAGVIYANEKYVGDVLKFGVLDVLKLGARVEKGKVIAQGSFRNLLFYKFVGRIILLMMFLFIGVLVYLAAQKREREN